MKLASSQQLYAYWNALRGARGAPERNDIEPGAIRGVLSDTFILEYSAKARFPFRVVGGRTSALFGRELREAAFLGLWREDDAHEIVRVIEGVADGAQPFLIGARSSPEGAAALDLEVLLLPLRALQIASLRALTLTPSPGLRLRQPPHRGFLRRGHLFVYSSGS